MIKAKLIHWNRTKTEGKELKEKKHMKQIQKQGQTLSHT